MMTFSFRQDIYPLVALLKAAYRFTDSSYVHLDAVDDHYVVNIRPKEGSADIDLEEFQNEILAQTVRKLVSDDTKQVRELLLARSLSSTVIPETPAETTPSKEQCPSVIDDILMDWFEKYE